MAEESVKIYSSQKKSFDGELEAQEYIVHFNNGNLAIAHQLGHDLAVLFSSMTVERKYVQQQWVLLSYLTESLVESSIGISLLAHSVFSKFVSVLEELNPAMIQLVHDSRARTLYALNQSKREPKSVGVIFSEIVGQDNNNEVIVYANILAETYSNKVLNLINSVHFHSVAEV